MIFLLGNIIFSSFFGLCIKWVQNRKREDILTIGMINYIVGLLVILPEFLMNSGNGFDTYAALTGGAMGLCYFIAYFFVVFAIKWIGASASTVISVLSIVVPILAGIFIWHERPSPLQVFGIILALMALSLIGGSTQSQKKKIKATNNNDLNVEKRPLERPWFTPLILISFFALCGISRLSQEAFKHVSDPALHRPTFLFVAFAIASIPSVIYLIYRRQRISAMEWGFGIGLGLTNILQTHFILKSLQYFEGFVVFPVASAGGLMFTTIVATLFLHERLTRKTCVGVAIAIVALFLLHWIR